MSLVLQTTEYGRLEGTRTNLTLFEALARHENDDTSILLIVHDSVALHSSQSRSFRVRRWLGGANDTSSDETGDVEGSCEVDVDDPLERSEIKWLSVRSDSLGSTHHASARCISSDHSSLTHFSDGGDSSTMYRSAHFGVFAPLLVDDPDRLLDVLLLLDIALDKYCSLAS